MRNQLKSHGGRHRSPLYLATIVALLGAGVAGAAGTAPVASVKDGLMTFPNVVVVNAPQLAAPIAQAPTAGMKAYIDPATGALRQPTQEELVAESQAGQRAGTLSLQSIQEGTEFVTPSGAIGVTLGESSMVFSVARKTDDGGLAEFCVVGPEQVTKVMDLKAPELSATQRKERRNDR